MNIAFIGMPGSGKSTFGAYVAKFMNMQLIDTDAEICKKYGDIGVLFQSGENLFREIEKNELLAAANSDNSVIACGGGAVLCKEAMHAILQNSLVVYLQCDSELLQKRLIESEQKRPLLAGDENSLLQKIQQLEKQRSELYLRYSQITLDVSGILSSRNLLDSELSDQLGALQLELLLALERRVHKKFK